MSSQHVIYQTRREFLHGLTLASTAGVLGFGPWAVTAEPALETTTIRLVKIPTICQAPQYVAEELLREEGFTDVQYVKKKGTGGIPQALASGEADINGHFAVPLITEIEAGAPIVVLAGLHIGCFIQAGKVAEGLEFLRTQASPPAARLERLANELANRAETDMVESLDASHKAYVTSQ